MAKFRKKPVVVDAEQWFPGGQVEGVEFPVPPEYLAALAQLGEKFDERCGMIRTLEAPFIIWPGDWVITGPQGERWPVKPDIFVVFYENVDAHIA